jgi:hypothetical protein
MLPMNRDKWTDEFLEGMPSHMVPPADRAAGRDVPIGRD